MSRRAAAEERLAFIALALVPGIGHARLRNLLARFGTAHGALAAPSAHLCTVPGMSVAAATAVSEADIGIAEQALLAADRLGGTVLVEGDADYPAALVNIPDPPPVLFAAGDLALLGRPAVAVVGSRVPTMYGVDVCRSIVGFAAAAGLVVVSGMARGIDAAAHEHALALRGATVGVLGNGLGVVYPAANRRLYERMVAAGLLLTEFPPGERPHAGSFPRRNRLISGLAKATIVVEAAKRSGALITATTALDQGREALAVPGPITSPTSEGTNALIRDGGAGAYLGPVDLFQHFPDVVLPAEATAPGNSASPTESPMLSGAGAELLAVAAALGRDGVAVDALAARTGMAVADLLGHLSALEITGFAEQVPGGRFRRASGTGASRPA